MLDNLWVPEGKLLGIGIKIGGKRETLWWRVQGREFADYNYSFASIARAIATGYIDLQDAVNNFILNPLRTDIINHFYVGITPATMLMYLQYPAGVEKNALVGNRTVDNTGNGAIRGYESPLNAPARKSELFTLFNLRPRLNMYNNGPITAVPSIRLYAMMYSVDGPFVAGDPAVGDEDYLRQLVDHGEARVTSIYGVDPANLPTDFIDAVNSSRSRVKSGGAPAAAGRIAFHEAMARV